MKLAPLLLAAPVVFGIAAADPRAGPDRRVLDRWRFARQDESTSAAGGGGGGAASTTPAASPSPSPTSSAAPATSATPETTSTRETTSTTPTSAAQPTTTTPTSTRQAATSTTPSAVVTPSAAASNTAATTPTQQATPTTPTTTEFSLSTPPPTTAALSTTDQHGNVVTTYIIMTPAPTSVVASPSATAAPKSDGVSKSTVIGLAVTGSIAGLLIILLIVWKLTNKRFSDLEDTGDDDAIKWPELNKDSAAMTPIPARPSTRAGGTDTDTLGGRDFDNQSAVHSTADLSYAPYSDDPGYGTRPQYYDPYGGTPGAAKLYPSPPGSHDGDHKNWGAPADPQYYEVPRGASPGPNAIARGMSPGPTMAYDNRVASPAPPSMAYADPVGRTGSPGPAAYGYAGGYAQPDPYGGRHSPGPNMAYAQPEVDPYGRRSPGPGVAYNGSVGRVASPGPNAAYR